jgi:hypothetical protein
MSRKRSLVRHARLRRDILKNVALLLLLAAAAYLLYLHKWASGMSTEAYSQGNGGPQDMIAYLETENAALRRKLAIQHRAHQIERKTYARLEDTLHRLQKERFDLRQELRVYKDIMGEKYAVGGINIQDLSVEPADSDRSYRFWLVLTRLTNDDAPISAAVHISIVGEQGAEPKELALSEVSSHQLPEIEVTFQHFKRINGQLRLPHGFSPRQFYVRLVLDDKQQQTMEKTFDWTTALSYRNLGEGT